MKLGVISDIHGNFAALKTVINELEKEKCDSIICLGDIVGYYSEINSCIELIREKSVYCIKGNHDSYLIDRKKCPRSNSVNKCIDYQMGVITKDNLQWLKENLGEYIYRDNFFAVHGGWNDYLDEYVKKFDFDSMREKYSNIKIFCSGHSHVQLKEEKYGITYFNPGSVGQPRDYDSRAAYAIIENYTVKLMRVKYNIDETCEAMKKAGFSEYFYENLYYGTKIGEKNEKGKDFICNTML